MTAAADISRALRVVETGGRMEAAEAMALADCEISHAHGAGGAALPRRPRHARELLQEGVHPADQAVPRRLPLLHVRARAARTASRTTSPPRLCWTSRAAGQAAGCKEALFTLGDQPELRYAAAREACARSASDSTLDYLAKSARAGAEGDGPAAASQSRRDGRGLARPPAQGVRVAGHHAGDGVRAAVASAAARTSARPTSCRPCGSPRWRPPARARALHHRHPDRHRRDAGRAHRGAAGDPRRCTSATGTSRR